MVSAHRITSARACFSLIRFAVLFVLVIACTFALSGCAKDPEIATPPTNDDQEEQTVDEEVDDDVDGTDDTTDDQETEIDEGVDTETVDDDQGQGETTSTHEGPYVISIFNAGGENGLAAAAEETLADNGIEGDDYQISIDSYTGGTVPNTVVYVTGEGDDADAILSEAQRVAEALGATVETFDSSQITEVTMDDIDILVLVGTDAV